MDKLICSFIFVILPVFRFTIASAQFLREGMPPKHATGSVVTSIDSVKHGNLNAVLKHKDTNKSQKHFMNGNDGLSTKDSSKWFDEMNTQEFSLEERLDNRKNLTKCQLVVSQRSKNNFKERVLYEDANSLLLKLGFSAIIQARGSTDTISLFCHSNGGGFFEIHCSIYICHMQQMFGHLVC